MIRMDESKLLKSQRVRKVIQLLCIVLLRIKYKMHVGAFSILMYIGMLLEDFEPVEYTLGRIVYSLIRKVSFQISSHRKNVHSVQFLKRHNRGSFGNAAVCPLLYVFSLIDSEYLSGEGLGSTEEVAVNCGKMFWRVDS